MRFKTIALAVWDGDNLMKSINFAQKEEGGFRHALRLASRDAHDSAEAQFSRFQADPAREMNWFLAAQRSGLAALSLARSDASQGVCCLVLDDLIGRLDFDLEKRGVRADAVVSDHPLNVTAVDYLVLGSRLGTEVLRRGLAPQLTHSEMPTYFLAPAAGALWQRHCRLLDAVDPNGREAARIKDDVIYGFELFDRAGKAQRSSRVDTEFEGLRA
ncbi:heme oxygenase [Sagittula marina]|uniref:Heme oxygenase n=2 Tax=Sagittula marina TaxID=943940 RepID=A0A7W6GSV7_9RHOB|nr:heme oxygenase [Sagittula marina]